MTRSREVEDLLRRLAPRVLAAVARRHRDFDAAEDAVQEALLTAVAEWGERGVPASPLGWLITVASRRLTDHVRREAAGRRREETVAARIPADEKHASAADAVEPDDDTLALLLLCCHPELTPASQIALTLRAVGGLSTAEIAGAFLVPESTMAQRISRAKSRLASTGARFRLPPESERAVRLPAVLHVLYLIFNEGYTATSGPALHRAELTSEALRLTRALHGLRPDDGEVAGLLALMLLTEARRPARTTPDGGLVPLAEQDRERWDSGAREEGLALVTATLPRGPVGSYQLQAAIAAVHAEAAHAGDTDWPQIAALYALLATLDPGPVVALNRAVAVAKVDGPHAGLAMLEDLDDELAGHHRLHAVRAHLSEMAGDRATAREGYRTAARLTTSLPEQRYLAERADGLTDP